MTARVPLLLATVALGACGPSAPPCSEVSGHVGTMFAPPDSYSLEVEGAFLARCVTDDWSAEVRRCILSTTSLADPKNCKAKMTPAQAKLLDADLAQAERHERGRALPKACLDLEVQVAAAMSCEAIPKAERDRIQKQLAISKAGWDKVIDKQLLAPTCGAAIAALRQATLDCKPNTPGPTK